MLEGRIMLQLMDNQPILPLQQDMELIDILYMQDIDMGIGREAYRVDEELNKNETKQLLDNNLKYTDNETVPEDISPRSDEFPQLDLAGQYIVDGETGELVFVSSPMPQLNESYQQQQLQDEVSDMVPDTPQIELLQPEYSNSLVSIGQTQQQMVSYERQSSMDQRWNDILNILGLPSTPSGPMSDVNPLSSVQYDVNNSSSLILQNASMTSALELSQNDSFTLQPDTSVSFPNYTGLGLDNASMSLFVNTDDTTITSQCGHSFTSLPNTSLGIDLGLFNNLSLIPVFSLESGEPESYRTFSMTSPTESLVNSFSQLDAASQSMYNNVQQTIPTTSNDGVSALELNNNNNTQSLIQELLHNDMLESDLADDIDISDIIDDEDIVSSGAAVAVSEEDWFSDSAVSSMDSPVQQNFASFLEEGGATGGLPKYEAFRAKSDTSDSTEFHDSFPFKYQSETSSNYTDMPPSSVTSATKNMIHNHTYTLPHGRKSRDELEEEARREKEERATRSRDEKRAKALKIPLTMDEIIDSSVEEFSELVSFHRLNEAQLQLVRDIRRRGKNKMAAQNCRKRKMEVIQTIEEEVTSLRERRDMLRRQRIDLDRHSATLKDKFKRLESELFHQLRNESGHEYDPRLYSLLQTEDGGVFIVPRTNTSNEQQQRGVASIDQSHDDKKTHKRKSKRKD